MGHMDLFSTPLDGAYILQEWHSVIMAEVLQLDGCGVAYAALQDLDNTLACFMRSLEDMCCFAMQGPAEVLKAYNRRTLHWQSL